MVDDRNSWKNFRSGEHFGECSVLDSVFTSTYASTYSSVYTAIYSRMFYRLLPPGGTKLMIEILGRIFGLENTSMSVRS